MRVKQSAEATESIARITKTITTVGDSFSKKSTKEERAGIREFIPKGLLYLTTAGLGNQTRNVSLSVSVLFYGRLAYNPRMKRHEIICGIVRPPLDAVVIFGCFFLAQEIRRATDLIPGIQLPVQVISAFQLALFALGGSLLALVFLWARGLYRIRISGSRLGEVAGVIRAMFSWFFTYIGILYLSNGYLYSTPIPRLVIFFALVLAVVFLLLNRIIINGIQDFFLGRGWLQKRRAVVVMGQSDTEVIERFSRSRIFELVGYFSQQKNDNIPLPFLGLPQEAEHHLENIDDLFYVNSDLSEEDRLALFEATRFRGVRYSYFPNVFESDKRNVEMHFLGKSPVVEIKSVGLDAWGRVGKRLTDIAGSIILLVFLGIPLLLLLLWIWMKDGHSPLYRSVRVGKGGRTFTLLKIRTMIPDADRLKSSLQANNERTDGPLFKIEKDPRVTPLGRFLRRTGLDEIPQLWNVLRGDMSLVGPRPHLPEEVEKYRPHQRRVLTIKPGITGMAQVHGRHKNSFDREVELDTLYIENWSLLLDGKIFAKTISAVLGKGV